MHETLHTTHTRTRSRTALVAISLSLLTLAAAPLGCRGDRTDAPPRRFFPDMDYQPKLKPQSETEFFVNGNGQRPLVEGTVAFGTTTIDPSTIESESWGETYLRERHSIYTDDLTFATGLLMEGSSEYATDMPIEMSRELIARGQERFDIYCSACHGYDGAGGDSGTVGRLWSIPPANLSYDAKYTDKSVETGRDGYLFHVIRNGLYTPDGAVRMPSYWHAIDETDAWAIVAYLRVLQEAHAGDPSTIDSSILSTLGEPPAPETMDTESTDGGEG